MNLKIVLDQIECDKHNIQEWVNMLSHTKTKQEYISIQAQIKRTVKEIKQQRLLIQDKLNPDLNRQIALFEVEPTIQEIDYSCIDSIFGII